MLIDRWLHRQWLKRGIWCWLMAPFSVLYASIVWLRRKQHQVLNTSSNSLAPRVLVPVLIVGNLYIGGTGKTPVVIALVRQLKALGWHPGVISRGYGSRIGDKPLIGLGNLDAKKFGDEPSLVARETGVPVSVHPDRPLACRMLVEQHPEVNVVISDDGLQHLKLQRDLEIIVQDERGCGNGWVLPAGPLREPATRLGMADAVVTRTIAPVSSNSQQACLLDGGISHVNTPRRTSVYLSVPRFYRLIDREVKDSEAFLQLAQQGSLGAVAGIAEPARFFNSLRGLGLNLKETLALPDHFSYDTLPFSSVTTDLIVITGKDAVKCEQITDPRIWVADPELTFSDADFLPWLDQKLHIIRAQLRGD